MVDCGVDYTGDGEYTIGMTLTAVTTAHYLANSPDGANYVCLVIALVLFITAVIAAAKAFPWWSIVLSAGFVAFVLAFMLR